MLKDKPVLIFRPADGYRVMAVVPCQAIVFYSRAFVFEHSIESEPSPMTFPVIAPSGGFSADLPGMSSCVVELPRRGREVVTFACGNQLRVGARRAL